MTCGMWSAVVLFHNLIRQAGTAINWIPASNQEHKVSLTTHVNRWHALQHCQAEKAVLQYRSEQHCWAAEFDTGLPM